MIDTYMDRASWPTWMNTTPTVDIDDRRYWNGALYNTVIDRMVAEAKYILLTEIALNHCYHATMVRVGFNRARAALGVTA
jgi:hypothetical protein